jgi:hypothetical protein
MWQLKMQNWRLKFGTVINIEEAKAKILYNRNKEKVKLFLQQACGEGVRGRGCHVFQTVGS